MACNGMSDGEIMEDAGTLCGAVSDKICIHGNGQISSSKFLPRTFSIVRLFLITLSFIDAFSRQICI